MAERLTRDDWIAHGLRTLATSGAGALKAAPLADALNVSRGSFYWHFKDIGDFQRQLLASWQERATEAVIRDIAALESEPERLNRLLQRAFSEQPGLNHAVRMWAAADDAVAKVVASVDARRVAFIAELIAGGTTIGPAMLERARFLYWAYLGQSMAPPGLDTISASTIAHIADLFEG